ncbi:MAG: response regulator transcription factor [Ktedonobacterales bacterium]
MTEPHEQRPIQVLIVDDHPMAREGTRALLERSATIEVVGALGEGLPALWLLRELQPDVVLLDVRLPDISGIEVARQLRTEFPAVKVLVVTGYDEIGYARALLQLGVRGYLAKSASGAELVAAVRAVAAGNQVITAEAARVIVEGRNAPLTAREHEVLQRLVAGRRNAEIADDLCLSLKTVEFHVRNVLQKLGARSRAEAIGLALQHGIHLPGAAHEQR